ncbi:MAG: hypothetical protein KH230_13650 [Enterocloster asparagiformis]|nr:hypothetical protein [Enterocloster asparagiformis]
MIAGFEPALRGMRNPMNSWDKSDSKHVWPADIDGKDDIRGCHLLIGDNDMQLAQRLISGGSEHRKFIRQIQVWVDITAPQYWWSEFDTYKVGTVANSTSKMHKLVSTPITKDCFEMDHYSNLPIDTYYVDPNATVDDIWNVVVEYAEKLRIRYLETKDKMYWKELIRLLPESWLQTRTVSMNYENIRNIVHQRKNHKLTEWSDSFIQWARTLPYSNELIFYDGSEDGE